mmetsp:Transcript_17961/g.30206  ORF Transcript_17961/g.30206 Transcript_17961/m.30206 type:complete len:305 (-) Transcript_17961:347-1261(-)
MLSTYGVELSTSSGEEVFIGLRFLRRCTPSSSSCSSLSICSPLRYASPMDRVTWEMPSTLGSSGSEGLLTTPIPRGWDACSWSTSTVLVVLCFLLISYGSTSPSNSTPSTARLSPMFATTRGASHISSSGRSITRSSSATVRGPCGRCSARAAAIKHAPLVYILWSFLDMLIMIFSTSAKASTSALPGGTPASNSLRYSTGNRCVICSALVTPPWPSITAYSPPWPGPKTGSIKRRSSHGKLLASMWYDIDVISLRGSLGSRHVSPKELGADLYSFSFITMDAASSAVRGGKYSCAKIVQEVVG